MITVSIGTFPDFVLWIRRLEIPRSVTLWDPVTFISFECWYDKITKWSTSMMILYINITKLENLHTNLIILPVEQDNAPLIFEESYHQRLYDEQKRWGILLLKYIWSSSEVPLLIVAHQQSEKLYSNMIITIVCRIWGTSI